MKSTTRGQNRQDIPGPQDNYAEAVRRAFADLGGQSDEQVRWLGGEPCAGGWRLPVLNDPWTVDPPAQRITTSGGLPVGPVWSVLSLHYLAVVARPEPRDPEITFADLPSGRTYAGVYQGRVVRRLCAKVGRNADTLDKACKSLGGQPAAGGDLAYEFQAFPRVSLRLLWHAADDEFPPSATLLLPGNIAEFFCVEDIVVLSEALVSRLGGAGF
ncbi:MAG: DUF3786 domain-containing protein [Pirellulales bacterium]|nr:DUF3786 domain-containing protein [Pirellulales bacterium]